jgi:GTPase SAR1 family protein
MLLVAVMVGLDGSGKTTIVNRLKDRRGLQLVPPEETIGEEGIDKALESQSDDLRPNLLQSENLR